jgi:hypothetical protein
MFEKVQAIEAVTVRRRSSVGAAEIHALNAATAAEEGKEGATVEGGADAEKDKAGN